MNDGLRISADIREQLNSAMEDLNTAVENYSVSYQNSVDMSTITSSIKTDMTDLINYCIGKIEYPDIIGIFSPIDDYSPTIKTNVEENYTEMATLCSLYLGVSTTLKIMLEATDKLFTEDDLLANNGNALALLQNGKLGELFATNSELIEASCAELFEKAGIKFSTKLGEGSSELLFGAIFGSVFKESLIGTNVTSETTAALIEQFFSGEPINAETLGNLSIDTIKGIFKDGIKDSMTSSFLERAKEGGEKSFYAYLFDDISKAELSIKGKLITKGVAGFAVTFAANVITGLVEKGEFSWGIVGDAAANAAISTISSLIVEYVTAAAGLGSIGGPGGVVVGAVGAAVTAILSYGGQKLYEAIKFNFTHYGDGVPKSYEHMTNDQIVEMLTQAGYNFSVPKYGEQSAYDVANAYAQAGAPPEIIAIIEGAANNQLDISTVQDANGNEIRLYNEDGSPTPYMEGLYIAWNNPGISPDNGAFEAADPSLVQAIETVYNFRMEHPELNATQNELSMFFMNEPYSTNLGF